MTEIDHIDGSLRLAASHLVKIYKKRRVVRDVSVEIGEGEIVGLLGPNGAGKTTTFYMIVGLVRPDDGHVTLGDDDITDLPMYLRAQRGISYLPQEASVFRKLTVEENLLSVFETMGLPLAERERRMRVLLEEFGITHIARNRAYSLSGGERRRISYLPQEPSVFRKLTVEENLLNGELAKDR